MGPSWPTRREFSMGLILGLVLQRNQLTDEGVGERFERTGTVFGWERGGRAGHELAQPRLHVLLDQPARAGPAPPAQRGQPRPPPPPPPRPAPPAPPAPPRRRGPPGRGRGPARRRRIEAASVSGMPS